MKLPWPYRLPELLRAWRGDLRHAVRVMAATAVCFAIYHLFDLPQGYWAVFTVVIVMQASIGGTVSASVDRLIGTVAGAVIGGTAAALRPQTPEALGVALVLSIGVTSLAAAARPNLKVAPVTAAIMLLSPSGALGPLHAALFRVLEIGLGSVVAVAATLFIFPARSHATVLTRLATVLELMAKAADVTAARLAPDAAEPPPPPPLDRIRAALGALEAAMTDAAQERRAHLGEHRVPDAVLRTLWRMRTDWAAAERALDSPLAPGVAARLAPAARAILSAEAALMRACAKAAAGESKVERAGSLAAFAAFHEGLEALRRARLTADLTFDDAGRVFALGFALESLFRNLSDLADRIDELAKGHPPDGPTEEG